MQGEPLFFWLARAWSPPLCSDFFGWYVIRIATWHLIHLSYVSRITLRHCHYQCGNVETKEGWKGHKSQSNQQWIDLELTNASCSRMVIIAVNVDTYRVQILENRPRAVRENGLPPLLFLTGVVQTFPVDGGFVDVLVLNESVWASHQIKYLNDAVNVYCWWWSTFSKSISYGSTCSVCERRNVERFLERWCSRV